MTNNTMTTPEQILAAVANRKQLMSYKVTALATSLGESYTGSGTEAPEIRECIDAMRRCAAYLETVEWNPEA